MKACTISIFLSLFVFLDCLYLFGYNPMTLCEKNDSVNQEAFISKIEENLYVKNFQFSNVLQFESKGWKLMNNLKIPSNQIFKLFKFKEAIRIITPHDISFARFYNGYLSGKYSIHDLLISTWEDEKNYGVILFNDANESQCAALKKFYNNDDLSIILNQYPKREAANILDVLSRETVWSQLKNSNLNLMDTNIIVVDGLDFLSPYWGILFYDNVNEYYMSLYDSKYSQSGIGSEYILPEEKASFTLSAYCLYNFKAEIAPFMYKEHLLNERIAIRGHNAWLEN